MDSSKDTVKDNLPAKKPKMGEKHPETEGTEGTCQEKGLMRDIPVSSPMKRKSESCFEHQIKRSTDNANKESNESLTDYANIEDAKNLEGKLSADIRRVVAQNNEDLTVNSQSKFTDLLKEPENRLVNVVSHDETTEENIKEQGIVTDQTDQSPIKYKITETSKTDFETRETEASNEISKTDKAQNREKVLSLKDADVSSAGKHSVSQIERSFLSSSLDVIKSGEINPSNTVRSESSSEEDSKNEDIVTENLSKIQNFPETVDASNIGDGSEPVKYPSKMLNAGFFSNIPLHISHSLYNKTESDVSNISEGSEHTSKETRTPQKDVIRGIQPRSISRASPVKLFSDSGSNLNQIYKEAESNLINLEYMENNPHFIESQRLILESISHEQAFLSKEPESDDKENLSLPSDNSSPEGDAELPLEAVLKICGLAQILADSLNSKGNNLDDLSVMELTYMLTGLAQTYDPDSIPNIPYVVTNYRECLRQSPEEIRIFHEKLIEERLGTNEKPVNPVILFQRVLENLPLFLKPNSPDSSPPEDEPENNSDTDSREFVGNQSLSEGSTGVKKDSRYQKKFYKKNNPASLPLNRSGAAASISDIETNRDAEENQMQVIDDPQFVGPKLEDSIHEESGEDSNIQLKDKDILKVSEKSPKDKLSETSESASEDKISSFMKESLSISHSLSTKRNDDENMTQSPIEGTSELEGLGARFTVTASEVSSTQAVASQSPSTQAVASQSPSTQAVASQSPSTQAVASQTKNKVE